ncbi:host cell division inhibitor Icd-like protein [Xenorhabdus bovienii]|uniref:host cell division inhibitor Icd-like protein n=1 Tax=Xenorhabdus bovienii TaxID=40576 RepID=UPI00237CA161|nr:host cell division inhibitor Icd-like protein [Xenorhabdus bovienii]MDE1476204.1 host cell division inhibitor Icd-like protein [Xenorhabdus bovienii]MDE9443380.1 host cell division inhibitor Icd-like protein [Xenorhabdus bovienii]
MYTYKFAAICRTDKKNHIHFFTTIADSEISARQQFSQKFVLFFRARLPFGGAI